MPDTDTSPGHETDTDSAAHQAATSERERASPKNWLAVIAVAIGIFSLVTAEQLPIGLLTSIGSTLHVSEGTTGLMVTVPGLVAAVTAPVLPVAVGRLDRRVLLIALITLMAGASVLSAAAPNFPVLLASRFLVGISIGGFWAIAGSLAVRLVPAPAVPRATSLIFGGVAAASVIGVPAGTLIGELGGWRTAFAVLGGLGAAVLVALLLLLPALPASEPVRVSALTAQLRNHRVRAGVLATGLLVTGHFAAYTFVSPALQDLSGIAENRISSLLVAYGIAGIVGNFVLGSAAGRNVRRALLVISLTLAATLALFPLLGTTTVSGIALLILWGLAFGGVSVSLQTWMLQAAPKAAEAATSLFTSMFNLSIALGALVGGIVVDSVSVTGMLWLAGALVVLTALAIGRRTPAAVPDTIGTTGTTQE